MVRPRVAALLLVVSVAACTSSPRPPPISPETAAELTVRAVRRACPDCGERPTFVRGELLKSDTLLGDELPMPPEVRAALGEDLDAVIVGRDEELDLFDADGELPEGGAVVSVAPVEKLAPGVVGIDVGIVRRAFDFRSRTFLFRWDGATWRDSTPDETGVTVTSGVS